MSSKLAIWAFFLTDVKTGWVELGAMEIKFMPYMLSYYELPDITSDNIWVNIWPIDVICHNFITSI